jgi:hypothetical protein
VIAKEDREREHVEQKSRRINKKIDPAKEMREDES